MTTNQTATWRSIGEAGGPENLWKQIITDFRTRADIWQEIPEEMYDYALNVLPPQEWVRSTCSFLMGETYMHFENDEAFYGFTRCGNRFFGRIVPRMKFHSMVAEFLRSSSLPK